MATSPHLSVHFKAAFSCVLASEKSPFLDLRLEVTQVCPLLTPARCMYVLTQEEGVLWVRRKTRGPCVGFSHHLYFLRTTKQIEKGSFGFRL